MTGTGVILKGVGGFYTLLSEGEEHVCKARGRFRKDGVKPLPGDIADFEDGYLLELHERKNVLARPAVANIDRLVVTLAFSKPAPDFLLVDRLLLQAAMHSISAILVVNKSDSRKDKETLAAAEGYRAAGFELVVCSAKSGEGLEALTPLLANKTSAFAGQSAVGKSSLLNALFPALSLKTGELSARTERGKHTTRHAELIPLTGGGLVVDTPGFSLLETEAIEPWELAALYPEFREYIELCRFPACLHHTEPDCAVKANLKPESGGRYERYLTILEELNQKRRHRFD